MAYISRRQEAPPHMTPEYLAFNNKGEILSITGTFTGIALVAVLFRVYVRCVMLRVFGMDDYIIVLAMVRSFDSVCCRGESRSTDRSAVVAVDWSNDLHPWGDTSWARTTPRHLDDGGFNSILQVDVRAVASHRFGRQHCENLSRVVACSAVEEDEIRQVPLGSN